MAALGSAQLLAQTIANKKQGTKAKTQKIETDSSGKNAYEMITISKNWLQWTRKNPQNWNEVQHQGVTIPYPALPCPTLPTLHYTKLLYPTPPDPTLPTLPFTTLHYHTPLHSALRYPVLPILPYTTTPTLPFSTPPNPTISYLALPCAIRLSQICFISFEE